MDSTESSVGCPFDVQADKMAVAASNKRIVVAGASGRIGPALVDRLARDGHEIVLLGRDPNALKRRFANVRCASYDDEAALQNAFALINLAARNNDRPGSEKEFRQANVCLTRALYEAANRAGLNRFVQLSTNRAIAPLSGDLYGLTKRQAEDWLGEAKGTPVTIVRLPAVHSGSLAGRLGVLDRILPAKLSPSRLIAALRPQISLERATDEIALAATTSELPSEIVELADDQDDNPLYNIGRRTIDIGFALAVLIFFSWLWLAIWLAIRLNSAGPGLFRQTRVGRATRPFTCYKFRTMRVGTKQVATHKISRAEVTRVGASLRRFKLDELPQVLNLLRGDMTLVGPRPCLPNQHELIAARLARGVYRLVPGITGWAQINDIDMSDPERLAIADAQYATRRSLLLNLKILMATFTGRGMADRTRSD